jgi:hypothetical protein
MFIPSAAKEVQVDLNKIICSWMLRRQYILYDDHERQWVERGFARFTFAADDAAGKAVIDEPLIILHAAKWLAASAKTKNETKDMVKYVLDNICDPVGRGTRFEEFLVVYFSTVFGSGVRLCDVFDFVEKPPPWAKTKHVELVAITSSGGVHKVDFTSSDAVGPSSTLCTDLPSTKDTMDWFRHPTTIMCFPDKLFGPDIVLFVRVDNNMTICIVVQARFRNRPTLSKADMTDAVNTLEPSEFYKHRVFTLYKLNL